MTVTATQLAKLPPSKSYNVPIIIVQHQASKPSQTHFAITSTLLVPHSTQPPTSSGQSMQRLTGTSQQRTAVPTVDTACVAGSIRVGKAPQLLRRV